MAWSMDDFKTRFNTFAFYSESWIQTPFTLQQLSDSLETQLFFRTAPEVILENAPTTSSCKWTQLHGNKNKIVRTHPKKIIHDIECTLVKLCSYFSSKFRNLFTPSMNTDKCNQRFNLFSWTAAAWISTILGYERIFIFWMHWPDKVAFWVLRCWQTRVLRPFNLDISWTATTVLQVRWGLISPQSVCLRLFWTDLTFRQRDIVQKTSRFAMSRQHPYVAEMI